ncbi:non-homologous end-joining DNA ligase [Rhizobium hainanense]|uniref:DNA ligase (ATP) n=1 Tax=Rhizobium hainanense TaxID=52131 RepID=A0A1C3WBZ6_9HYPH|nr:non-homologous end-joining DNA ligase [Rhizobium hainanense]SCB37579.1 bifunctional non-homologous end joining protein LigD [Rhizobium hainanense]
MSKRSQPLLADDKPLRGRTRKRRDPAQLNLLLDPMPDRVEPALALLKPKPPSDPRYIAELKFDGYRGSIHIEPSGARFLTRGGHDWTARFPAVAEAARKLGVASAILDGEAVVLDEQGRSEFGALQRSLGGRGGKLASRNSVFYAFDLLYLDGHDLRTMELSSRRHLLEELIDGREGAIRFSEQIEGDAVSIFDAACEHGLEGVIFKDPDSPYRSGRTGDWIKVKCIQSESFFVVGYEKSAVARAGVGSLLLAARRGDDLQYVGSVGTGFKYKDALELREMLDKLVMRKAPIDYDGRRKNVVWAQPTLIAEIEYRAWTDDGKLRHASYKGLREVQDNAAVYEIEE